jgi:hypothetical protein
MNAQTEKAGTFTSAHLDARGVHRRAVEAVNWGLAAVNFDLVLQAAVRAKGATWKTLTPNPMYVSSRRQPDARQ